MFLLTAVALAPALSIIGFNELSLRQSREAEIHDYALRIGQLASLEMQRVITGAAALMVAIASDSSVQRGDAAECGAYLSRLQRQLPQLSVIIVTDNSGAPRCATGNGADQTRLEASPTILQSLGKTMFAVGEYTETSEGPALQLGARITNETGTHQGNVVAGLSLEYLGTLIRERDFARGSALTVADRNGRILAREPLPERFVGTTIPDPFLALVHADKPGAIPVLSQDGTRRIIGYYPATDSLGLYVSAGISQEEAFVPIDEATRRGIALALGGGLVAFLLAWLFGRVFIRNPVHRMRRTIDAWRAGDLSARTGMRAGAGDLDDVGASIDSLLDELAVRAEEREVVARHRDLLNAELDHRVKNLLATVQAIAGQTFKTATDPAAALKVFSGRLSVLSNAHRVLTAENWTSAEISETVEAALSLFDGEQRSRFEVSGARLRVRSKAALALSMALHELCTNAIKYGALSNAAGKVSIEWHMEEGARGRVLVLTWREHDGPAVTPPSRRGFGSRMIEQALASDIEAEVELSYLPDGVRCRIVAPLAHFAEDVSEPAPVRAAAS